MSIDKAGQLVDYIRECVKEHGATPHTEVYIRDGINGSLKRIAEVKMMRDDHGQAIILETSAILVS